MQPSIKGDLMGVIVLPKVDVGLTAWLLSLVAGACCGQGARGAVL